MAGPNDSSSPAGAASEHPEGWDFPGSWFVYVGMDNDEIATFRMDPASGELSPVASSRAGRHPSFLAFAPSKRFVYAVNEFSNELAAFSIDRGSGALSCLNRVSTLGAEPAFASVDASGKWVLAANYRSGPVVVFPVQPDGSLGAPTDVKTTGVHPHAIVLDRSNEFAFVPNKGSDKISQFGFDATSGTLVASSPSEIATPAGSEPRHLAFHPVYDFVYVIEESGCHVETYALDARAGTLSHLGSISTLPPGDAASSNTGSDVHVAPSGKFLYGSNRGHDSIVIYAIGNDGRLTLVGHESTRGKTPRNFGIDPTGTFVLAANQGSDSVVVFRVNQANGSLQPTGQTVEVGSPVCVKFMSPPQ